MSIASTAVFRAVSYPKVLLVPARSLSIVPGIPTTLTPCSSSKILPPSKEPLPPITTSELMPYLSKLFLALSLPSFVLNSKHLADFRIVPPLFTIFFTERAFSFLISSEISPSNPL